MKFHIIYSLFITQIKNILTFLWQKYTFVLFLVLLNVYIIIELFTQLLSTEMPVKRLHNQWFDENNDHLNDVDDKSQSIDPTIDANIEPNSDSNESYNGYKSSLNDSVVDDLVSTLTNKLCLKSTNRLCRSSRLSPYQIHNSSVYRSHQNHSCYCLNCKYLCESNANTKTKTKTGLKRSSSMSDTYELMQQLLKEGSLIKEAVKRLQIDGQQPMADKKAIDFYIESDDDFNQNENQINRLNS